MDKKQTLKIENLQGTSLELNLGENKLVIPPYGAKEGLPLEYAYYHDWRKAVRSGTAVVTIEEH
jgi:hypothetical protein